MAGYPFAEIEKKWQEYWLTNQTFRTPDQVDMSKPKYYVLDMFPYPSGAGLHVGHPEGYTATDILARYKRKKGFNVLHPMGWDAFGLPAEQYAIETGTHPRATTLGNIERFREQLRALGFSYDWEREVSTIDPDYYKWTQWIFLQLYERGLAYQAEVPVNWCPALGTVLANEEIVDGKSERGGHPVVRKPMKQWMLRITAYADRLLDDLETVEWPTSIKEMQRNWIGRSEGAEVDFAVDGAPDKKIRVYTTRPDTLFGATYMVLAPEHEWVGELTTAENAARVTAYQEQALHKSDLERTELQKTKSGVETGSFAINPVNGERIPIWIADYVLASYGTGAIMAVPAHDSRDYEFAKAFGLDIREVVSGGDVANEPYTGDGKLVNSASELVSIDGLDVSTGKAKITEWLAEQGLGEPKVNYKLRDWLFSRQRYWGEPFPVLHTEDGHTAVPVADLPVTLPDVESYKPSGTAESPLSVIHDWLNTTDPVSGKPAKRETNTMPQWAGSCWYYLRFISPRNGEALVDPELEKYWMPVDLYVGGAEHAVLHLLYARFWHKVLYDIGVVSTPEPFGRLFNQGMILGELEYTAYKDPSGTWISSESLPSNPEAYETVSLEESETTKNGQDFVLAEDPSIKVQARANKMSKSRGNVVNPDDVVSQFGADSLRLYEMFMGPLDQVKPWSTKGVEGVHRFLSRAWRMLVDESGGLHSGVVEVAANEEQVRLINYTIKKVTDDIEGMRFNTAIAAMMEFVNGAMKWENRPRSAVRQFVILLSPFAPHIAEEFWKLLGNRESLAYEPWPTWDEATLETSTVDLPVQVNGKVRGTLTIAKDADKETVLAQAKVQENVARFLDGATIRKEIYVPGRIVNFVVG